MPESLQKFVDTQVRRRGGGNGSEYFRALKQKNAMVGWVFVVK